MEKVILYAVDRRIASITLNRPDKRNALNPDLVSELKDALRAADEDPAVKVIVIKAAGSSFSAGADLAYLQQIGNNSYEENLKDSQRLAELFRLIHRLEKIVIAQVEGHAIAGGCGLAAVCDISFAIPEAIFGYTETRIGFVPAIVASFLLRKIPGNVARELLLTGRTFSAAEALTYGLINFVTKKEEITQKVSEFAIDLCENNSGNSLAVTKRLVTMNLNTSLEDSLENAIRINAEVRESEDFKKGIGSFLRKEKLNW
ncbi:methylglutaconyl-CoA hydratase [Pedobacter yulinensis]|uniref:Methylglutaconyl-CoA hydratase n=1 Tax=Pedobacter yulinensis TaxID=2126353 RepID=A0A2T3HLJ3_9SPHI|nr:enoyl-CoA hydratase-related protein [Pedobacter yulinensis]PST83315.1 methylglutaconyl-CoA hydratase [Pedobacter yulinensis]